MDKRFNAVRIIAAFCALAFWLLFIALSFQSYFYLDPPDAARAGTGVYGHNSGGEFQTFAIISAVEFAIVYLIVRPHSFDKNAWRRILVALVPLAPWTFLILLAAMHSSSVYGLHMLWLLVLNLLLIVAALAAFAVWLVSRRKNSANLAPSINLP